jgi:hypothetical protein
VKRLSALGIGGLLLGTIALASPLPAAAAPAKRAPADPVEARIEAMHSSFHITSAQESLWKEVAQAMRENAKAMTDLRKARSEQTPPLNAVEELKAYATAVEAHEDGLHKFIPVFQTLYESMSDAQKKIADAKFRGDARARAKKDKQ